MVRLCSQIFTTRHSPDNERHTLTKKGRFITNNTNENTNVARQHSFGRGKEIISYHT